MAELDVRVAIQCSTELIQQYLDYKKTDSPWQFVLLMTTEKSQEVHTASNCLPEEALHLIASAAVNLPRDSSKYEAVSYLEK